MRRSQVVWLAPLLAALGAGACGDDSRGEGIGTRPFSPPELDVLPLVISEVAPAAAYVELWAYAGAPDCDADADGEPDCVPLVDLFFDDGRALTPLALPGGVALPETLAVGATLEVVAPEGLSPSAGELAVVGEDGTVHAYLAWGGSPSAWGTGLSVRAATSGLWEPGEFVPVGFPAPSTTAIVGLLEAQGCANPSPGTPAVVSDIDPALCPGEPAALVLRELYFARADEASWVELENASAAPLPVGGVRLCVDLRCAALPASTPALAAGAELVVFLGAEGPLPEGTAAAIAAELQALGPTGEVALYAPSMSGFEDATALLSYVAFGAPGSRVAPTAVAAGLWSDAALYVEAPRLSGESLAQSREPLSPLAPWYPASPTPGADNPPLGPADDASWTSCSAPRPWDPSPSSPLVVGLVEAGRIVLENRGEAPLTLTGWELTLVAVDADQATSEASLPLSRPGEPTPIPIDLSPGGELVVVFGSSDCGPGLCFPAAAGATAAGEVALFEASTLRHYVAWGTAPRLHVTAAVTQNVWPEAACAAHALSVEAPVILREGATGHSPADYD